jgi:hypothetical protein
MDAEKAKSATISRRTSLLAFLICGHLRHPFICVRLVEVTRSDQS